MNANQTGALVLIQEAINGVWNLDDSASISDRVKIIDNLMRAIAELRGAYTYVDGLRQTIGMGLIDDETGFITRCLTIIGTQLGAPFPSEPQPNHEGTLLLESNETKRDFLLHGGSH